MDPLTTSEARVNGSVKANATTISSSLALSRARDGGTTARRPVGRTRVAVGRVDGLCFDPPSLFSCKEAFMNTATSPGSRPQRSHSKWRIEAWLDRTADALMKGADEIAARFDALLKAVERRFAGGR